MFKKAIIGAVAAAGIMASVTSSYASLNVDIVPQSTIDASTLAVGSVIYFNIVATVTVGSPDGIANDAFQTAYGSIYQTVSDGGSVLGTLSFTASAPFTATTYGGISQDINGDGIVDLGALSDSNTANNYIAARASALQYSTTADSVTFAIGVLAYTITDVIDTGTTTLTWIPRTTSPAAAATWRENGTTIAPATGGVYTGGSVSIAHVPEPATVGILALAGAGLMLRRRSR